MAAKQSPPAEPKQIAPGVHWLSTGRGLGAANVYFVGSAASWTQHTHSKVTTAAGHSGPVHKAVEIGTALSMTVGRGPVARAIAGAARLTPADRVVDVGCGPGTAVREAARAGASATGVDPSPVMLGLARLISSMPKATRVGWAEGSAEELPLADGAATVVWAISSVHHWADPARGLAEIHRVLGPGGRVLLAERLVKQGARGHAGHGRTQAQADDLAAEMTAAGYAAVGSEIIKAGRRTMIVLCGQRR